MFCKNQTVPNFEAIDFFLSLIILSGRLFLRDTNEYRNDTNSKSTQENTI